MIGIYKITNPKGNVYIGQSRNLVNREKQYSNYKHSHRQVKLYNSIKKYGWDNHVFEIIEECSFEQLNIRERYWQEYFDCINNGLNCLYTKTNVKPCEFSKETKEKMRIAQTGKKHSKETINKMSEKRKGYKIDEVTKKKLSKAHLGRKKSKKHCKNIGKAVSKRLKKPISCISPKGEYFEFDSFKSAAFKIGVSPQSISLAFNKNRSCREWTEFKLIEIVKKKQR